VLNNTLASQHEVHRAGNGDSVNVLGLGDVSDNKGGTPVVPIRRP
jgi:hypothetical protein